KKRNVSDYPAAGLHWNVKFNEGENQLRAVGKGVSDELTVGYQTKKWGKPAKLKLEEIGQKDGIATMEVRMLDTNDVPCLDCSNIVRFGLAGDGRLIDNLGTSTGSRVVQLYNGRATIQCEITNYKVAVSVSSEGRKPQFKYVTDARVPAPGTEKPKTTPKATSEAKTPTSKLTLDIASIDKERILKAATAALEQKPVSITTSPAKLSEGGPNDFYSNGDYWWPDPSKPNGLPYIKRDGETNPENFIAHRMAVKALRDSVAALAAAYKITGDDKYVTKAAELLQVFFLDAKTRMNPSLNFAQAVPGVSPGRGIGIIDTLHIIEIPAAVKAMEQSKAFPADMVKDLRQWFRELAEWMVTSDNGKDEAKAKNNHAVAFHLQLAVFADFIGDKAKLELCRQQFKEVFLPKQMAEDGSFPLELARTKPYGYSIFQLDNMTLLCQVLSTAEDNLWTFQTKDGKSIAKAIAYLHPFLADKSKWTLKPDVNAWEGWPARQPNLIFGGLALGEQRYLDLWQKLPADPTDPEVQRNIGITQPILWVK
ncbi:MAG: alginate lyase family protein, partial [Prosthecobacter sp.]|uniref:alginate lyase family protein n=1 Tax=Prosthecobacter sp. TaxID=1965333 RepID=UPI0038FE83F5